MRKFIIALALVLATSTVFAKVASFKSCTADQKVVVLKVDFNEQQKDIEKHIQTAFNFAANQLTADDLHEFGGFVVFASQLSEDDLKAINELTPPAVAAGSCKVG
jgi:hypothetical protein